MTSLAPTAEYTRLEPADGTLGVVGLPDPLPPNWLHAVVSKTANSGRVDRIRIFGRLVIDTGTLQSEYPMSSGLVLRMSECPWRAA